MEQRNKISAEQAVKEINEYLREAKKALEQNWGIELDEPQKQRAGQSICISCHDEDRKKYSVTLPEKKFKEPFKESYLGIIECLNILNQMDEEYEKKVDSIQKECDQKIKEYEQGKDNCLKRIESVNQEIGEKTKKIEELKKLKEKEMTDSEKNRLLSDIKTFEKAIESSQNKIEQTTEKKEPLQQEIKQFRKTESEISQAIDDNNQILDNLRQKLCDYKEEEDKEALDESIKCHEEVISRHQGSLQKIKNDIVEKEEKMKAFDGPISNLNSSIKRYKKLIEENKKKVKAIEEKIQEKVKSLCQEISSYESLQKALKENRDNLLNEKNGYQQQIDSQRSELDSISVENKCLVRLVSLYQYINKGNKNKLEKLLELKFKSNFFQEKFESAINKILSIFTNLFNKLPRVKLQRPHCSFYKPPVEEEEFKGRANRIEKILNDFKKEMPNPVLGFGRAL